MIHINSDMIKEFSTKFNENNTNLLELQEKILKSNDKNIKLIFDKNKITKEMNSFRKCMLKKICYKINEIKKKTY